MKLRDAALATLPEEVAGRIAGLVEEMYESVVGGELSAAEAEERVAQLGREVGREVLSAGWWERSPDRPPDPPTRRRPARRWARRWAGRPSADPW